ncbi:AraC family transcriptional regulator [Alcaligenes faecalis]|uniref:AraC family transcriptional regulator n=2 Tax=Alcaligenes faecalis TaxID=511 RepID=UPI003555ED03
MLTTALTASRNWSRTGHVPRAPWNASWCSPCWIVTHFNSLMSARLLRQTSSSTVAQVAYSVGLSDLSYFHCPFRRRFDITPGDFYSHDLES